MAYDRTVLVTNVSFPLGQGVLRLLARLQCGLRLLGVSRDRVSAGNHLCDGMYHVPWPGGRPEPDYVDRLARICHDENVSLIVPCTDIETVLLTDPRADLPPIACSPYETSRLSYDKYLSWLALSERGVPFAQSTLPSRFEREFERCIVKPRTGGLSMGIEYDPPDPAAFSDDFVVQRLYFGTEITTAFYVDRLGGLLGHISMERELRNGITFKCMVTKAFDTVVGKVLEQLVEACTFRGSCNLQSIVTDDGEVVPFEINARISGSASIRAHFGFDDLRYLVDEYLYGRAPDRPNVVPGSAVRMLTDVIYPGVQLDEIHVGKVNQHYYF